MLELSPFVTEAKAPASFDTGLAEVVAVEAEADHGLAAEVGTETTEGPRVLVDDGDGVSGMLECAGELAADPTTSDDDDVQNRPPVPSSDGGCYGVAGQLSETGYGFGAPGDGMLAAGQRRA